MTQKEINYNGEAQKRHRNLMIGVKKTTLFKKLGLSKDLGNYRNFLIGNRDRFPLPKLDIIEKYMKDLTA